MAFMLRSTLGHRSIDMFGRSCGVCTGNDRFRHERRAHRGDVDTPCRNPVPKLSCAETSYRPFSG